MFSLWRDADVISTDDCEVLQAAFSDITAWRIRASLVNEDNHAAFDALALTVAERTRLGVHIENIREFLGHSEFKMPTAPILIC